MRHLCYLIYRILYLMKIKAIPILIFCFLLICSSRAEPRKVLFEYCAGTWCGICPCGHITADSLIRDYPGLVPIVYHGPENSPNDPFSSYNGNEILNMLGLIGYPSALFDRASGDPKSYFYWRALLQQRLSSSPEAKVSLGLISKTYNTQSGELSFSLSAKALENLNGNFRICYLITEDNLIYNQNNYGACTTGTLINFRHDHVARGFVNGAQGEALIQGSWNLNQVINKTVSTTLNANWVPQNCNVIIFVYKDSVPFYSSEIQQVLVQSVTNPIGIQNNEMPESFSLSQNYPNPFNPVTNISFSLMYQALVSLVVYDAMGREVAVLLNSELKAGKYNAVFNGDKLSSGIYFYKLMAGNFSDTKKMVLIK